MSVRAIDGDEPLFDFDATESFEEREAAQIQSHLSSGAPTMALPAELFDMSFIPQFSHLDLSSFSAASTPAEVVDYISKTHAQDAYESFEVNGNVESFKGKGKAVSQPMDIMPRDNTAPRFDLFSFNGGMPGPSRQRNINPNPSSSVSSPQSPEYFAFSPTSDIRQGSIATSYATDITSPGSSFAGDAKELGDGEERKMNSADMGKSRAGPPLLPPLLFSPTTFSQGETNWPTDISASPEAIVPADQHTSSTAREPTSRPVSLALSTDSDSFSSGPRPPSRPRSFSALSTESFRRNAARPLIRSKQNLISGKRPGNLARKLLLKSDGRDYEPELSNPTNTPIEGAEHEPFASLSAPTTPYHTQTFVSRDSYRNSVASESLPDPSYFETTLPKEIKLEVLQILLLLHEAEGERLLRSSSWTAEKAGQKENRWIGRQKGFVELVRLSRVSKSWQTLVFDGQLWSDLDLRAFPDMCSHLLSRMAASSGSFIRSINLTGHTRLTETSLLDITKHFCIHNTISDGPASTTQLTDINLSGCSSITTHALHILLTQSPSLTRLNLKGLSAVTNETCRTLAIHCPSLNSLDLSLCHGMDAHGVISFITPHIECRTVLPLERLRLSGLRRASDKLLSLLGRYAPNLEVLDLSGARELHNTALEAFVACSDDYKNPQEVLLTSWEAGRDPRASTKYRRRVTKLRHLSLSYCPLLTDNACSHLAHALPNLEFLELAGVGAELKDDGLVRLLNTTPLIRRLDLDEACELTDATLAALTLQIEEGEYRNVSSPQTGSRLEALNLSYGVHLTNDALLSLVRNCTCLVHLELDSTRVNGSTVKEFVRLSRKRQAVNAEIVIVDCRSVSDAAVKDLVGSTRTRKGWRAWEAQHLNFLDARDDEALGVGTDECDEKRVALKSFYHWQTVDAVEAAREKRWMTKKNINSRETKVGGDEDYFSARKPSSRWWSPGSRRASGSASPTNWSTDRDREGCIIM